MSESVSKGPVSYFPSIEKKYGQPIAHWQQIVRDGYPAKHMELVALLKTWSAQAGGPFVIESTRKFIHGGSRTVYRCSQHFESLYDWLRKHGVTARKPLHELRKELGALLASSQGIFAAQAVMRHAQIATTASYYVDKKRRITAGLGALLAAPVAAGTAERVTSRKLPKASWSNCNRLKR